MERSAMRTAPVAATEALRITRVCTPRIAIFTHDTFGLGHLRRCLHIVRALAGRRPDAAILFISGSPALHVFGDLPANADYLKVPTVAKTGSKFHQPPHLPISLAGVGLMRERLIREAAVAFAPDVFLVDNFPLGSQGELLSTLQELRRLRTRIVLGLRDILDAPEVVRRDWTRQGMYDVLDRYYDRILVYGVPDVLDVERAYGLPPTIASKTSYCGYVTADGAPVRPPADTGRALGVSGPFLLAEGGGGGDGFPLLRTFLEALKHLSDPPAVAVTGPLMSASDRERLTALVTDRPGILLRDYVPDLGRHFGAAELVVAMCGYNSAAEIVATRARAVVVPRTWRYGEHRVGPAAGEEWEQLLRARALARLGLLDLVEPAQLTPEGLAERMRAALARPRPEGIHAPSMQGLDTAALEILSLIA